MTNPPADAIKVLDDVEVTQADRNRAADLVRQGNPGVGNGNKVVGDRIKGGLHDSYAVVQAFARHRIASTIPDPAALAAAEARGRVVERADVVEWLRGEGTAMTYAAMMIRNACAKALEAGEHLAKEARS